MTTKTTTRPAEIIEKLTARGRETMTAVGDWNGSFFDEGCTPGSGIWGSIFVQEMGQKSSGVINRLRDLGLFDVTPDQEGDDGDWWSLTQLGVDVARALVLETVTLDRVADAIERSQEDAAETPVEADEEADKAAAVEFSAEPVEAAENGDEDLSITKDWEVRVMGEAVVIDFHNGSVFALPKDKAAELGAVLVKQGKQAAAPTEIDVVKCGELFMAQGTGIKITDEFVAAKAYARAKGTDATGQGWTIYQYASGKTELVPLKAAGKAKDICKSLVSELGKGEVKPSGYIVLSA